MSSDFDDKPPPPPLRFTSQREPHAYMDLKPLPREPEYGDDYHGGKKKKEKSKSFKKSKDKEKISEKPVISLPSNFEHTVHVGYDPQTGEFTGNCA
jgi:p21-activated kinase 1